MSILRTFILSALCISLVAVTFPSVAAAPVAVGTTNSVSAEYVAVSGTGSATCTTSTCVAVSGTNTATAGAGCTGFVCASFAASGTGAPRARTYCDTFGQVCLAVTLGTAPSVYGCYGDVTNAGFCRGFL